MPETHPISDPATVTVYGADWCGDCRRAKRVLEERGTTFEWIDVALHPEIRQALTASGYPAIPVILLPGGEILMEPLDAELAAALDSFEERLVG